MLPLSRAREATLSRRFENAFQFRPPEAAYDARMGEPELKFVQTDEVPFTEVVAQLHGNRRASVHIKFLEWTPHLFVAHTRYDPGLVLERHGHSSDHTLFILEGELAVGDRICTPGTLVVLERGAAFGPLVAGPGGVTFLEHHAGDVTPVPVDKEGYRTLLAELGIERLPNLEFTRPPDAPGGDLGEGDRWS